MSLWRLEWLRLVRTRRWLVLVGVFVLFGFVGPVGARYLPDLVKNAGHGVRVIVPKPTPADGIAQFISNASGIGVVVAVVVAVASLAFDAKPGLGVFYRTHIRRAPALVLPRYLVVAAASVVAFGLGTLAAVYETAVLLGGLPVSTMLLGMGLESLYLLVAIAVAAAATALVRGVLGAVGAAIGFLLAMPIVGNVQAVNRWLPSGLSTSMGSLVDGRATAGSFLRPAVAGAVLTVALLGFAVSRVRHREL
ncbi:MAG TPA: hypothetical protein VHA57_07060 [Actinomycetota bacterium]|nr:hypothetical protein [Actinomycetota bacterium]